MFVELVNVSCLELAGGDPLREEHVQLVKCAALGFGKAKEGPDEDKGCGGTPDETSATDFSQLLISKPCTFFQSRDATYYPFRFQAVGFIK